MVNPAQKNGLLAVISGPSGVGKSTVLSRLFQFQDEFWFSVSVTTRPARPSETEGSDYFFVDEKSFFGMEKKGELLEWAQVHGFYYGTPRGPIEEKLAEGKTVVVEVDVQGAQKIRQLVDLGEIPKEKAVFVFLIPPSVDILALRLRRRKTEDTETMNFRLRAALAELQVMEKYDYIVVNDRVDNAVEKIRAIIRAEKERVQLS